MNAPEGETAEERVNRGHVQRSWWRKWAGSIAFVGLILLTVSGFYKIEVTRYDGCESGNDLRAGLRTAERQSIAQARAIDPEILFPSIPDEVYRRLLLQSELATMERIHELYADRGCGSVWPFRP